MDGDGGEKIDATQRKEKEHTDAEEDEQLSVLNHFPRGHIISLWAGIHRQKNIYILYMLYI